MIETFSFRSAYALVPNYTEDGLCECCGDEPSTIGACTYDKDEWLLCRKCFDNCESSAMPD